MMKKEKIGSLILVVLAIVSITVLFLTEPIKQDEGYHHFSDSRAILGISNFWNVLSNIPFAIVSFLGLYKLKILCNKEKAYLLLFVGIGLISIGSGYYHLHVGNQSLVCDRLPMTIVFMTLFSIIIMEFISVKTGRLLLIPLVLSGLLSVGYWVFSTSGDLRFYVLVQFYPMIAIPIILIFFKSSYSKSYVYWGLLLAYIIAKLLEHYDSEIYQCLKFISGHSLKHIVAAFGLYMLQRSYQTRHLTNQKQIQVDNSHRFRMNKVEMKKIPFLLIYSRIMIAIVIGVLAIFEVQSHQIFIVSLVTVGMLTDIFDGIIARKLGVSSEKLRVWDSNVDQFFWLTTIVSVFYLNILFIKENYLWIFVIVFLEVLAYLISYFKFKKTIATHSISAKFWTLSLLAFLIDLTINTCSELLFGVCIGLGIISRIEIIIIILKLKNWATDIPSIFAVDKINKGIAIKKHNLFNS